MEIVYQLGSHFAISGEVALSHFDQNVFSGFDDGDNLGQAYTLGANYLNDTSKLFGRNFGAINWQINWKRQQQRFSPLGRQFQPEYNYKWNLRSAKLITDENVLESNLKYQPAKIMQLNFDGGWIKRGDEISSLRGRGQLSLLDSTFLKTT